MDSNRFAAFILTAFLALPAAAYNHVETVSPIVQGPFNVACSNVAQDASRIAAGASASDYWEGRDGHYVTELLANPDAAITFRVHPPIDPLTYPTTWFRNVDFVAIVCYPTPRTNSDPNYTLPGTNDTVPHMEAPGAAPKLISAQEFYTTLGQSPQGASGTMRLPFILFSHGLTGSPISKGYVQILALLATHGYMVGAVFHGDPRISPVRIESLADLAYLIAFNSNIVEMQLMRPLSLKAFNDRMLGDSRYLPAIDTDRIGGFGASLGGEAMMHLLGADITTTLGYDCHSAPGDSRLKAAVTFVPYSGQSFLPAFCEGQTGAAKITKPVLSLAGTADTTAPIRMTQMATNRMKGTRYLVQLDDVPHQFLPEYAGDLVTWMTTFLNAYLQVPWDTGAMGRFIRMKGVAGGPNDSMTIDVHVPAPDPAIGLVREFHNTVTNHYFLAFTPEEVSEILGRNQAWELTGQTFKAFRAPTSFDAIGLAAGPVCRFYGPGPNSHFFTAVPSECDLVKSGRAGGWLFEGIGFYIVPVDSSLRCPTGWLGVNRAYNGREAQNDPNHRFSTSDSTMRDMQSQGWSYEATVMCTPP